MSQNCSDPVLLSRTSKSRRSSITVHTQQVLQEKMEGFRPLLLQIWVCEDFLGLESKATIPQSNRVLWPYLRFTVSGQLQDIDLLTTVRHRSR